MLVWDTMAMLSLAPANQRPAFRSPDLPRPIRGQELCPMSGLGSSPVIISDDNINHHYNCEGIRQTSVNTLQCLETSESETSSSNITIWVHCLSFSHIICFPLQYKRQEVHKVLNNKQTIEDNLIVCLSNISHSSLIDMHLKQGKQEHSNIIGIKRNRKSQQDEASQTNFPHGPRGNEN